MQCLACICALLVLCQPTLHLEQDENEGNVLSRDVKSERKIRSGLSERKIRSDFSDLEDENFEEPSSKKRSLWSRRAATRTQKRRSFEPKPHQHNRRTIPRHRSAEMERQQHRNYQMEKTQVEYPEMESNIVQRDSHGRCGRKQRRRKRISKTQEQNDVQMGQGEVKAKNLRKRRFRQDEEEEERLARENYLSAADSIERQKRRSGTLRTRRKIKREPKFNSIDEDYLKRLRRQVEDEETAWDESEGEAQEAADYVNELEKGNEELEDGERRSRMIDVRENYESENPRQRDLANEEETENFSNEERYLQNEQRYLGNEGNVGGREEKFTGDEKRLMDSGVKRQHNHVPATKLQNVRKVAGKRKNGERRRWVYINNVYQYPTRNQPSNNNNRKMKDIVNSDSRRVRRVHRKLPEEQELLKEEASWDKQYAAEEAEENERDHRQAEMTEAEREAKDQDVSNVQEQQQQQQEGESVDKFHAVPVGREIEKEQMPAPAYVIDRRNQYPKDANPAKSFVLLNSARRENLGYKGWTIIFVVILNVLLFAL